MLRIRSLIPLSCLKSLYFSLIHPFFLYVLPVFGATYANHLEPLKLLQKRAIRLISGAAYFDHTEPLFFQNKILKLDDLYKHSIACYAYKNPETLNEFQRDHRFNTRYRDLLLPPLERLRSSQQSVVYNAVVIWNDIPNSIKECPSLVSFKFQYRKYLLEQYNVQ